MNIEQDEILDELTIKMGDLLELYSPCRGGSDYTCAFCRCGIDSDYKKDYHSPDCFGKKLDRFLQKRWDERNNS